MDKCGYSVPSREIKENPDIKNNHMSLHLHNKNLVMIQVGHSAGSILTVSNFQSVFLDKSQITELIHKLFRAWEELE